MISIGKLTSVEQAVRYLRDAVAQQQLEYYTARRVPGRWSGLGAEALGLRGEVTDTDFAAVLAAHIHARVRTSANTAEADGRRFDVTGQHPRT